MKQPRLAGVQRSECLKFMTRIVFFLLVLILSVAVLVGCSQGPEWAPRISGKPPTELARSSPLIVLGTVVAENLMGATVAVGNDGQVRLQKIDLDVEAVLKGNADARQISFYRYRWDADWLMKSPPIDAIMPGERSVFFLDQMNDELRTALDVTVSRVKIFSGEHDFGSSRLAGRPIEEQIAYLMLTPGENVPDAFGETLSTQTLDAMTLVGETRTLELLKPLLKNSSEAIRINVCLTMAQWFTGQSRCLGDLPSSGTGILSPERIRILIGENQRRDGALRERLRRGDIRGLERIVVGNNAGGVCDYLRAMTAHQDPEIANLASNVLEKQYPDSRRSGCPPIF